MCEKCVQIDEKIERYRKLSQGISDPLVIESAKNLIQDLEVRKAQFHPEKNE